MTGTFPDRTGMACPKCGFVRPAAAPNPAWQCPQCQVAYHKVTPVARFAAAGQQLAGEAGRDASVASLLAANALAAGIAWWAEISLRELMLVYWMQSVIIGLSFCVRMLSLERFSTSGTTMNGRPIPETAAAKRQMAFFFALHFGIFHAVYLAFLLAGARAGPSPVAPIAVALGALVFLANHAYSLAHNIALDRRGRPNLGTMMFLPYARILPMHLLILFGSLLGGGALAWWLFAALKTAADAVMHSVEHHVLRRGA